jgi:hypothetical protein
VRATQRFPSVHGLSLVRSAEYPRVNLRGVGAGAGSASCVRVPLVPGGKLPDSAHRAERLILVDTAPAGSVRGVVAAYAGVSSAGQGAELSRQVAWVTGSAAGEGLAAGRVVTEVGSRLNGRRGKFLAVLRDESVTVIVGTETGSPGSGPSTSRRRCQYRGAG